MIEFLLKYITLDGLIWLIIVLPLTASGINWTLSILGIKFGSRKVSSFATFVGVVGPFLSFASVAIVFWILTGLENTEPTAITAPLYQWISFLPFTPDGHVVGWGIDVSLRVDQLSLVMAMVITGVGSLIHLYSVGYMHGDESYPRYFAELNLFLFFMLLLVLGNNLILMFVGWEGVGLCSYLLIGFWFTDIEKAKAGKKAFIVNRIGDFGFIIGIFLIWKTLAGHAAIGQNPLDFETLERNAVVLLPLATPICLALFIGATGKSAQIPLYIWLPDAMAGPTPVSALIHAATMVTAGVYMVVRLNFIYILSPFTMQVIAITGAVTALFAALIGLTQKDIKKVLAYSTISQLGYMFLAAGVGAFGAAMFHLTTHAFFKAALFLGAGSVIHALHGEQDMFKMGGLKKYLPGTSTVFFVAALSISGIWPFAGFFSKDEILWQVYSRGNIGLWLIGFITAGITAFYIFRAVGLTFFGATRIPEEKRKTIHESSVSMLAPLVMLAILSISGGWMKDAFEHFLHPRFAAAAFEYNEMHGNLEHIMGIISVAWVVLWAFVAWIIYTQNLELVSKAADRFKRTHKLLYDKFYIDEFYNLIIIRPINWISEFVLWKGIDIPIIDNVFVNGSSRVVALFGKVARIAQTGLVPHYLFFMMIGLSVLIIWFIF